ncbi:hypothetical protein ACIQVT_34490 [Streptomyces sp. NPDC100445]|uniref:hypothetical protein n=1 Tax=Streptomyces sp. NPDC100445 TaxID=3366102 RepID=UPI003815221B
MTTRKPKLPGTYAESLEELRKVRKAIADAKARIDKGIERRDALVAHAATFPEANSGVISKASGTTAARVRQVVPGGMKASRLQSAVTTARAVASAPTNLAAKLAAAVGEPDAAGELPGSQEYATRMQRTAERAPRELPGIGETPVTIQHGAASTRKWTAQKNRVTLVLNVDGRAFAGNRGFRLDVGDGSAASILRALPEPVERVFICGARPWHTDTDSTMTDDVRAWLTAPLPEGWEAGRHFTHHENPVARFTYRPHEGRSRAVEIMHVASWVPGTTVDEPAVVWHAFRLLRDAIRQRWGSDAVELLGSPTTLGQDLWLRTIPQNREYPLMSAELRELIRTTSGQGRFELRVPRDADGAPAKLGGLHYFDCTFAYAGLTWGMPVGAPTHITGRAFEGMTGAAQEKAVRGRGRWHVRVTVPADWTHVGLLPCSGLSGWEYPAEPGRTFTTWASGAEVWLARQQGWHVEVIDGITWAEGKPLDLWRNKLVECWQSLNAWGVAAGEGYREAAALAAKMVRSVVLFTIGGFHSRGVAKRGITTDERLIPATARRAAEHDGVWEYESAKTDTAAPTAHPEWSAEVYGRMRARLLSGPGGTGALSVPADAVIAFRSDAMFLTANTGWSNPEGVPGRFRLKGSHGPVTAPTGEAELLALRDVMEGGQ